MLPYVCTFVHDWTVGPYWEDDFQKYDSHENLDLYMIFSAKPRACLQYTYPWLFCSKKLANCVHHSDIFQLEYCWAVREKQSTAPPSSIIHTHLGLWDTKVRIPGELKLKPSDESVWNHGRLGGKCGLAIFKTPHFFITTDFKGLSQLARALAARSSPNNCAKVLNCWIRPLGLYVGTVDTAATTSIPE